MASSTSWPFLPLEVVSNILSRLPVKSLLRFKSVCESWLRLISDPRFVAMHLEQSKKHPHILVLGRKYSNDSDADTLLCYEEQRQSYVPPLQVERWHRLNPHHCDGLVMLSSETNTFVCNPCTRELVCLHGSHRSEICPGFGFDPRTNSYKVVRVFQDSSTTMQFEVFTLGSSDGAWRTAGRPPEGCWLIEGWEAVTVNGVVYWIGYVPQAQMQEQDQEEWQLLAFDLRDESFRVIQIPHLFGCDEWCSFFVINHEGELCMIALSWDFPRKEIWVLSRHDDKWSKRYSFEFEEMKYYYKCPVVPVMLSGERCFLFSHRGYIYDMRNGGYGTISSNHDAHFVDSCAVYVESLVPVGPGPVVNES